jgi:DNA-binding NarL/FixJ family response regulator
VWAEEHALLADSMGVALGVDPMLDVFVVQISPIANTSRVSAAVPTVIVIEDLSLAGRLRAECPQARLIAIGSADDPEFVLACIRSGIDGCVSMKATIAEAVDTIKRVDAGESVFDPRAMRDLLDPSASRVVVHPQRTARLAPRELEVLIVIAKGFTTFEAARHLGISVNTLRTHLKNILTKLEARSKLEAVLIGIQEGRITFPEDPG